MVVMNRFIVHSQVLIDFELLKMIFEFATKFCEEKKVDEFELSDEHLIDVIQRFFICKLAILNFDYHSNDDC
jgi:hypothetical protein